MGLPIVREMWRLALPTGTLLLSGENGLSRVVQWARRMSIHPPALAALEEGEVVLLSVEAISLVDERLTLSQVIRALTKKETAALTHRRRGL